MKSSFLIIIFSFAIIILTFGVVNKVGIDVDCTLKDAYWSQKSGLWWGDNVQMIVEGEGNCADVDVVFDIYEKEVAQTDDDLVEESYGITTFEYIEDDDFLAQSSWNIKWWDQGGGANDDSIQKFYFIAKFTTDPTITINNRSLLDTKELIVKCDADNDGYNHTYIECEGLDCNDLDSTIHPNQFEICDNSIDENCDGRDGLISDSVTTEDPFEICWACEDNDSDGFYANSLNCPFDWHLDNEFRFGGIDCDDSNADLNPNKIDLCTDSIDSNCSGESISTCKEEKESIFGLEYGNANDYFKLYRLSAEDFA